MAPKQRRMSCARCRAEWWYTPGSSIHPMDHTRPDGRECRQGNPNAPRVSGYREIRKRREAAL
jgi:hypothetical protein